MKHFIDIERVKIQNNEFSCNNTEAFKVGDLIQISEKIDGSNASVTYNSSTGKLDCFSRKKELDWSNTLAGFWNYVQELDVARWAMYPDLVIFGEWCRKNKIRYNDDWYGKWIVYDIWDARREEWMLQSDVKEICKALGLEYIHVLYEGEFISWEHCKSFCHSPFYGPTQEGVVVKNQTRLNCKVNTPTVLKIVNEEFSEIKKHHNIQKNDPITEKVTKLVKIIVTERRIEKMLMKLREEGILPELIEPKDMRIVAQNLPRRVYEDCLKEEKEILLAIGKYSEEGGKMIANETMRLAKQLILGN